MLGIYGLALTLLFFVFQAPDVALSEIVVSGVGLPLIILAALRKIRCSRSRRREREETRSEPARAPRRCSRWPAPGLAVGAADRDARPAGLRRTATRSTGC